MFLRLLAVVAGCGGDGTKSPDDPPPEDCGNGTDDDLDGRTDCDDAECGCPEICDNGADDNGNGLLDCEDPGCTDPCVEDCLNSADDDGDGAIDCDDPDCEVCPEHCDEPGDEDADGLEDCADPDCLSSCDLDGDAYVDLALGGDDCDDADPDVNPGADERCNGVDDDCDAAIDDDDDGVADALDWYVDEDGDGFGNDDQRLERCEAPPGTVEAGGDCDDDAQDVNPDAQELCNGGVDDDCDGLAEDQDPDVDPASAPDLFADGDGDGLGVPPSIGTACVPGPGESLDDSDCDDTDPDVGGPIDWLDDSDGDGFGDGLPVANACTAPPATAPASAGVDCDDGDPLRYPGAPEVCDDGEDDDCDTILDCSDADCATDPACVGTCVDVVLPSSVPIVELGNTVGAVDDTTPSCAPSTAPDVAFSWTPPAPGPYTIDTAGSLYDTILYVLDACGGVELACNDDTLGIGLQSRVNINVAVVAPLVIVVDGYSGLSGAFTLNIY